GSNWVVYWHYTRLHPSYSPTSTHQNQTYQSKYAMDVLRQQAMTQLVYQFEGFRLSTGLRYQQRFTYQDYWLNDWRFAYTWGRAEAYLDVQNAFDTEYAELASAPLPGRWMHLGLKYRWSR